MMTELSLFKESALSMSREMKKIRMAETTWGGNQLTGDVSHKPGSRLPLLSTKPTVILATLKRAATSFAAWWTEARWVWTVCPRLLPDSVMTAVWTQALLRLWVQHANHSATEPLTFCKMSTKNQNPTTLAQITRPQQKVSRIFFWDDIFDLSFLLVDLLSWLLLMY